MTDQVKYLGVILDKQLDWKAYLTNADDFRLAAAYKKTYTQNSMWYDAG
jgi:hypothetical protein